MKETRRSGGGMSTSTVKSGMDVVRAAIEYGMFKKISGCDPYDDEAWVVDEIMRAIELYLDVGSEAA